MGKRKAEVRKEGTQTKDGEQAGLEQKQKNQSSPKRQSSTPQTTCQERGVPDDG